MQRSRLKGGSNTSEIALACARDDQHIRSGRGEMGSARLYVNISRNVLIAALPWYFLGGSDNSHLARLGEVILERCAVGDLRGFLGRSRN